MIMTNLYSHNQAWPQELPFRINTPEGTTRTDPTTFSVEELTAWGYTGPFTAPQYDKHTEVLEWTGNTFNVRPMTTEERQLVVDDQWVVIRNQRNYLLFESDWTQLSDSPTDKTAWATYRQALRDITQQSDPFNLIWPQKPTN
jgi:hypothetical protein